MNQRANEIKLNDEQFEQLQTLYIQTVVDSMSTKDLVRYVTNDMEDFCNTLSNEELIQEIEYTMSEEELQEFITTIKEDSEG